MLYYFNAVTTCVADHVLGLSFTSVSLEWSSAFSPSYEFNHEFNQPVCLQFKYFLSSEQLLLAPNINYRSSILQSIRASKKTAGVWNQAAYSVERGLLGFMFISYTQTSLTTRHELVMIDDIKITAGLCEKSTNTRIYIFFVLL